MNEHFKAILGNPEVQKLQGISVVLDAAPDFPIVLELANQELIDLFADDGVECPWNIGDVRYEVSDGMPGNRSHSDNFTEFLEAAEHAVKFQEEYAAATS